MRQLFEQITHIDGRVEYKPIKIEQAAQYKWHHEGNVMYQIKVEQAGVPTVPEWPPESGFCVMGDGDTYMSQPNLSKKQIEQFNFHPTKALAEKASAKMRYCNAIITVCQLFDPDSGPDWNDQKQVKKFPFWDGEKWVICKAYTYRTAPDYFGASVKEQDVIDWLTEHYPDGAK